MRAVVNKVPELTSCRAMDRGPSYLGDVDLPKEPLPAA